MNERPQVTRKVQMAIDREVAHFLKTGYHDDFNSAWPSPNFFDGAQEMSRYLRAALVAEVRKRESGCTFHKLSKGFDVKVFARKKVMPMVNGLFPAKERKTILNLLQDSLIFLTGDNIEQVLRHEEWGCTAWSLANIYLESIGVKGLHEKSADIVGISCGKTCFVSMAYFEEDDPFADFVVHEAAHVFHNWKRERVGIQFTRNKEWLLQIDFSKREQFAYACEAYSRIVEQAKNPADRRRLHAEYSRNPVPSCDDRIDHDELIDILAEAVEARNGWKRILRRCATS